MANTKQSKFSPTIKSEVTEESLFLIAVSELTKLVTSMFTWKNLPDGVPVDYIERTLLYNGSLIAFKNNENNQLMFATGAYSGINHYGLPVDYTITTPQYTSVFNKLTYKIGTEAVLIRSYGDQSTTMTNSYNWFGLPTVSPLNAIMTHASLMAKARATQIANMAVLKQPIIFTVDQKNEQAFKVLFNKMQHDEPALFVGNTKDRSIEDVIKLLDLNPKYYVDDLEDYYVNIKNTALSYFGINNFQSDKKERSLVGEVESNNQQLKLAIHSELSLRQQAVEQINSLFGTDISVELTAPMEESNEQLHSDV